MPAPRKWRLDGEIVEIDPTLADIAEIRPGVWSVLWNGASFTIHEAPGSLIAINAVEWTRALEDPRDRRAAAGASASGASEVKAAMPGKVVRLLVAPGDEIEAGQGLLTLEAMKMQNEVRSPRAGRVAALRVTEGSTVTAGQVLVTLE